MQRFLLDGVDLDGGGCPVDDQFERPAPIAAHAVLEGGTLTVHGFVGSPDGSEVYRDVERGAPADTEALGHRLAERIKAAGAGPLLERLRQEAAPAS